MLANFLAANPVTERCPFFGSESCYENAVHFFAASPVTACGRIFGSTQCNGMPTNFDSTSCDATLPNFTFGSKSSDVLLPNFGGKSWDELLQILVASAVTDCTSIFGNKSCDGVAEFRKLLGNKSSFWQQVL